MPETKIPPDFKPGFRLSKLDVGVLAIGVVAAASTWPILWWLGLGIAFVVGHFFLFCNVVRMSRPLELAWSTVFVATAAGTVLFDTPGWMATIVISLFTSVLLVFIETRRPSYHGVAWQRLNPKLPEWWKQQIETRTTQSIN